MSAITKRRDLPATGTDNSDKRDTGDTYAARDDCASHWSARLPHCRSCNWRARTHAQTKRNTHDSTAQQRAATQRGERESAVSFGVCHFAQVKPASAEQSLPALIEFAERRAPARLTCGA